MVVIGGSHSSFSLVVSWFYLRILFGLMHFIRQLDFSPMLPSYIVHPCYMDRCDVYLPMSLVNINDYISLGEAGH